MSSRILIFEDELGVRDSIGVWLSTEGYQAQTVASPLAALNAVRLERFGLVVMDYDTPGVNFPVFLDQIRESDPDIAVVVLASSTQLEMAIQKLGRRVHGYLSKPARASEFLHVVAVTLESRWTRLQTAQLQEDLKELFPAAITASQSSHAKHVVEMIYRASTTDATVLITGERGTGKEAVARAIHAASRRRMSPFVPVRCGALSESLLEAELLGEEPQRDGEHSVERSKFEIADGGTIFLDEIGSMGLPLQSHLIRVLGDKQIVRGGGAQPVKLDFRCIVATRQSLATLVRDGAFRSDLLYHLNMLSLELAPLVERREDIPQLVSQCLQRLCRLTNRPVPQVSPEAMTRLVAHDWPGNLRELEITLQTALLTGDGLEIRASDFVGYFRFEDVLDGCTLEDVERVHIARTLQKTHFNLSRTARILAIDRTTLYNKIRRYALR